MKAMILAAGEGTRLRPLTLALPKPLVPIANTPLLVRTLRLLAAQNIREIAVNLFHRAEEIERALGDGSALGVTLHYSPEPTLLGTAGGVKRMERFLDEPFLVVYGDNLWHGDFEPLIAFHREKRAAATIATFEAPNPSACGLVVTDADGRVTRFQEKPPLEEVFTNTANAGVYVIEPALLRRIPPDTPFDFARDLFPTLLDLGIIFACPFGGYLQDTGTVAAYRQANWDVLDGTAGDTPAAADGLLIGTNSEVAPTAVLEGRNVIGSGSAIGPGALLTESILWDGCRVGAGARISHAILGRNVTIGVGAILESGAIVADGATVADGARVPAETRMAPGERFAADNGSGGVPT